MVGRRSTGSSSDRSTKRRAERLNRFALALSVPLFLGGWELLSRSGIVNIVLFPPPSTVGTALLAWLESGQLLVDFGMSLSRVLVGYLSGAVVGILVGIITGNNVLVSNLLTPVFQLLRPIPPIAFVPIVILWFGLGELGKYFG